MFEKLEAKKVFADPLYGYVPVTYKVISELIDSRVFLRLRRISQLSGVKMVFHGAEHSRFNHSLGVYGLAVKLLNDNDKINEYLNEYEKVLLLSSALLHDVGHGPYSHAFERVFNFDHEALTIKFILEDEQLSNILNNAHPNLQEDIVSVISKEGKHPIIEQLVSSQLDLDRLDYIQRDAYYTGAQYGNLDLNRIFRLMDIKDKKVVYNIGAMHAIENYLISRYHMYWQVYYHPKARSHEVILEKIYERIYDLIKEDKLNDEDSIVFKELVDENLNINTYYHVDDYFVNGAIKRFSNHKDEILSNLCKMFLERDLFKHIVVDKTTENKFKNLNKYYYHEDFISQHTYLKDRHDILGDQIFLLTKEDEIKPIDEVSLIIEGLIKTGQKKEHRIYYKDE